MLSTELGKRDVFFKAALSKDYPQHLLNTIQASNRISEECAMELNKKGSSKNMVAHIVTAINQLEILLQFHGDLNAARQLREEQIDRIAKGIMEEARHDIQSA